MARTYFAVPSHYTIGGDYDTFAAAERAARESIETFMYAGQGPDGADLVRYSRAFVDLRVQDSSGDRPLFRWEVFNDGRAEQRETDDGIAAPVLPGPAGHWYANVEGELACLPMGWDDVAPPEHPDHGGAWDGWGSVDDPAGDDPAEYDALRRALGVAA